MLSTIIGLMMLATLIFGVIAGGRVERIGVAILAANIAAGLILRGVFGVGPSVPLVSFADALTALGYGVLAIRNPERLWPGVAGVAMTFVTVFSVTRATGFPLTGAAYDAALNLSGLLVQVSLFTGTCVHRWGRKPAADDVLAAA